MTTRQQWQTIAGVVLFFTGMALTGWMVDFTWPQRAGVLLLLLGASVNNAVLSQLRRRP